MVPCTMGVDWLTGTVRMTEPDAVLGVLMLTRAGIEEEMAGDADNEAALAVWGVATCTRAGMAEDVAVDAANEAACDVVTGTRVGMAAEVAGDVAKEAALAACGICSATKVLRREFVSSWATLSASRA